MEYFEIAVLFVVIVFIVIMLYKEILQPISIFFISTTVICSFGIITPHELLSGFSNEQVAVIVLLLVIGNFIQKTSAIDVFFGLIFRKAKTYSGFLVRMMTYIAIASAFFNNTPLVAMMMPYVNNWSKRNRISPSKLLIPLSYAAILGGCATLIGTSTNLLVAGMAVENGITSIEIFDFAYAGVPMIIFGLLYMVLVGHKILPDRKAIIDRFHEKSREYIVEAKIDKTSGLVGKSVEDAGLRNLKSLFLVEIIRGNYNIAPISPTRILRENDLLIFAGETSNIIDLVKTKGLSMPEVDAIAIQEKTDIVEVVVAQNSPFVHKPIKDTNFRSIYDAAIIAVHRNGERLSGKIGDIKLFAGDVLLLLAGKGFFSRKENLNEMHLISTVEEIHNYDFKKLFVLIGGLLAAVALSMFNIISLFQALTILLVLLLVFKIATLETIKQSIDFELIALIGLALGLGKAMINSGAAQLIADGFIFIFQPLGAVAMLAGIFAATNLLSSFITNKAAVSIIFPISLSLAQKLFAANEISDVEPFILIVAFAAAANFITPIGYQTNLMVYGAGGYTFKDFFRVGLPLTIIYLVVCVVSLSLVYKLF